MMSGRVKRRNLIILLHCLREYWLEILLGRKTTASCINRTPYYFYKVKKAISPSGTLGGFSIAKMINDIAILVWGCI